MHGTGKEVRKPAEPIFPISLFCRNLLCRLKLPGRLSILVSPHRPAGRCRPA